jgi:hypothetical protein
MNGKRPCKSNRPKERAKILDDFDHCVIKRTIHGLYSRKIAPTVFTYLHAKQSNACLYSSFFWGHQTYHSEATYNFIIICAVILVNPCFIHVHDIIPCFPKRFAPTVSIIHKEIKDSIKISKSKLTLIDLGYTY